MVDELVNLEEEVSFVAKQLSCNVLVLVCVEDIRITHHCHNAFNKVLEPLVDQGLHSRLELHWPFLLREVIKEILLHLLSHKILSFENSLVDRVEECQKHVDVEGRVEKLVSVFLGECRDEHAGLVRLLVDVVYLYLFRCCVHFAWGWMFLLNFLTNLWTGFFQWRLHSCRRIINWEYLLHMLQLTLVLLLVVNCWIH